MAILSAALAGFVFGMGLLLSGMADPAKVLGFLDVLGPWDPSLLAVMGGAVAVAAGGFAIASRRRRSLLGLPMQWPAARRIDAPLLGGSVLFGVGWGIAGLCPGPAVVALATGRVDIAVFFVAMVAGIVLHDAWRDPAGPRHPSATAATGSGPAR